MILFIDLLGVRQLLQTGGVRASKRAFDRFTAMVVAAAKGAPAGSVSGGGIETDAAMLVCESQEAAVGIAQRLYLGAFEQRSSPDDTRLWVRGSLVVHDGTPDLRRQVPLHPPLDSVSEWPYSTSALDAISIEKAGFKGMRLLLREEVVTDDLKMALRIPFNGYSFIPLRKLRHSQYPKPVEGELLDFLWMATGDEELWRSRMLQMTTRLRHSNRNPEEFAQAAATQVVFHECAAIWQSVQSRSRRSP